MQRGQFFRLGQNRAVRGAQLVQNSLEKIKNATKQEILNDRGKCKKGEGEGDKGEHQPIGNHASPTHISSILLEGKQKMQAPDKNNGVTYALIGSSGSGKSTLLRDVFLNDVYEDRADKEYIVTVFTESPQCDAFQKLPKKVNVDGAGVDLNLINWMYQMNATYDKKYNFVTILDDCIHLRYKSQIEKMFLVMRNTNITSVVSLQYANLIPRSIRTSVYFIFCMHQNTLEGVELMVISFLSAYLPGGTKAEKMDYYMSWTQNHRFFLIDNLNHKAYQVNENYECFELELRASSDGLLSSTVSHEEAEENEAETLTSVAPPLSQFQKEQEEKKQNARARRETSNKMKFDPGMEDAATGTSGLVRDPHTYSGKIGGREEARIASRRAGKERLFQDEKARIETEMAEEAAQKEAEAKRRPEAVIPKMPFGKYERQQMMSNIKQAMEDERLAKEFEEKEQSRMQWESGAPLEDMRQTEPMEDAPVGEIAGGRGRGKDKEAQRELAAMELEEMQELKKIADEVMLDEYPTPPPQSPEPPPSPPRKMEIEKYQPSKPSKEKLPTTRERDRPTPSSEEAPRYESPPPKPMRVDRERSPASKKYTPETRALERQSPTPTQKSTEALALELEKSIDQDMPPEEMRSKAIALAEKVLEETRKRKKEKKDIYETLEEIQGRGGPPNKKQRTKEPDPKQPQRKRKKRPESPIQIRKKK